tara:strand:+ start:3015 stop:3752 length:738 start_codon:yes stop_codon:yes gene_type:complete
MNFDKKKYINDGYLILKKIVPKTDISNFFKEIKILNKIYNKKNFETFFKNTKDRSLIYKKIQNLHSVRSITQNVSSKFLKNKIYSKLGFRVPTVINGLIVSLPDENSNLAPLHQDIYNFLSFNFIKIWIPLTKVNSKNGSMVAYKSTHKLGFIEPKYKNKDATYPEIAQKFTLGYKEVIFDLDPGDCVIFNPLILHKSLRNNSKVTRFNIGIDIQDFYINGDLKIINKMIKIRNKRSQRRQLINK